MPQNVELPPAGYFTLTFHITHILCTIATKLWLIVVGMSGTVSVYQAGSRNKLPDVKYGVRVSTETGQNREQIASL